MLIAGAETKHTCVQCHGAIVLLMMVSSVAVVVTDCNCRLPESLHLPIVGSIQGHGESVLLVTAGLTQCVFKMCP